MKIIDDPKYNQDYPEQYKWGLIDSRSGSEIGYTLASATALRLSLPINQRFEVPGLRAALNIMANYFEVQQ